MYLCVFILIVKFLILLFLAFLNYVLERCRDIHFCYWKLVLICFVITLRTLIRFSAAALIGFTATAALVLLTAALVLLTAALVLLTAALVLLTAALVLLAAA
jgi:hypothetical protein